MTGLWKIKIKKNEKEEKKTEQARKTKLNEEKLYVPGSILEIKGKYKSNRENAFGVASWWNDTNAH